MIKIRPELEMRESGQTWLGKIPADWLLFRAGGLFKERREKVSDREFPPLSVTKHGIVPQLENAAKTDDNDNRKKVVSGDYVINSRSDRKGSSGLSRLTGSVSLINTVITPVGIDPFFCNHLLRSVPFQEEYYRWGKGIVADLWSTNFSDLKNIKIPVPNPVEQRQIAAYLNRETAKIDKLIAKQQKLIKLLQEKRQAVISRAVTKGLDPNVKMKNSGVEWLGAVPEHWELVSLTRYLGKIVDYRGRTPTKSDSGVYLITARNIRKGFIDYDCSEEFILEEEYEDSMRRGKPEVGDLLFTMEAPLGNVALVDRTDVAIAQRVVKFRSMTEFLNSEYLMYSILGTYFQSQLETLATGSTALGLKASKLNQLRVLRPPINEQISISQVVKAQLTKLSVLDKKAHEQIALLKEHRQALITAAVTGKIDVRGLVTDEEVAALDAEQEVETTEEDFASEVLEDTYITEEE